MIFARSTAKAVVDSVFSWDKLEGKSGNIKLQALGYLKVPVDALFAFRDFMQTKEEFLDLDVSDWDEDCYSDFLCPDCHILAGYPIHEKTLDELILVNGEWKVPKAKTPEVTKEVPEDNAPEVPKEPELKAAKLPDLEPLGNPFLLEFSPSIKALIKREFSLASGSLVRDKKFITKNKVLILQRSFPTIAIVQFLKGEQIDISSLFELKDSIWYRNHDPYWAVNHAGTKISKEVKICGKLIDPYKGTQEDI